jgi:RNA-dependent RNA polymerase
MVLNLGRREIDIRFPSSYSDKTREYKFVIPIDQVFDLCQFQALNDAKTSFILTLRTPPHFYKKLSGDIAQTHDEAALTWREEHAWLRQTNVFGSAHEVAQSKSRSITLKNHPQGIVNIGRWTTYRIVVDDQSIDKEKYRVFRAALRDYNIPIAKVEDFRINREGEPAWDLLDASLSEYEAASSPSTARNALEHTLQGLLDSKKNSTYLPFPVQYQLSVCISNGWINEHNLTREFLETLSKSDETRAKHILECVAFNKSRIFDPMDIFELRVRKLPSMKSRIPENCVLIRSAIITPSTMLLNTPYVEMTNRVIRRYREHADRFLRVRFEDDEFRGYARISATSQKTMDEVLNKVFRTLTNGIIIGDRHYEFLAFGNSQLREHGAYFFAALPTGPTASHIRAWMGQFEHEKIVAKHAARIGQCFSTTRAIRNAGFPPVRKSHLVEDVERNGFNFTDGVGKISRFHAETIAKELGIRGPPPSVYQFRMAGCKGVLAIAPGLGATNVKLRKSQFKFETSYSGMEIIRCSEYWVATLNRQIILVLSALGVPDEIFLEIQDTEIQLMERAMIDDNSALEALTGHVDPCKMTLNIASLVQAGFRRSNEPFVTTLLGLWRAWSIKYLKEKARLPIRQGAFILGCTDETGTLRGHYDSDRISDNDDEVTKLAKVPEVFVQVTSPESGHRKVIEGLCLIARNPSLHPGDIRLVRAINVPSLHHLVDVLVLPQTGDRDIASMCSGGDLDGDDYVVIWDERLLPRIWNVEPMDYTPPPPIPLQRDVTQTDITKFFVKYMKNDFLPRIAHAHLAWGDFLDEGIRHEKCLDLAQLHSKAVDYPKSGQPAQMPKALNAKKWPHFMEKKGRNTYKSHKVLGQLYDAVDRVAFVPKYDAPFDERILNACDPPVDVMHEAQELKHEYDTSLQRIMAQHDIKTEFEVWSTFVLDHSKAAKDYKFHEEIGQLSGSLKEQYYSAVVEKAGGKTWSQLVPWAVAMYRITKEEVEAMKLQGNGASLPFMSFPWLLQNTLIQIVKGVDNMASKNHDQEGEDLLGLIQEPAFNAATQMYDDPYQPDTTESGHEIPSESREQEMATVEGEASSSVQRIPEAPNSWENTVSVERSDAHHIHNDGFPPGHFHSALTFPPHPTPEQYALIERIIHEPKSAVASPNLDASFSRQVNSVIKASEARELVEDGGKSLMDLSWPPLQPRSNTSLSVNKSRESAKTQTQSGGTSSTSKSGISTGNRRSAHSNQTSSEGSGALVDPEQAHGHEDDGRILKRSESTSISEDLAGLRLELKTSLLKSHTEVEKYDSKHRCSGLPSSSLDGNGKLLESDIDDGILQPRKFSKERNDPAKGGLSQAAYDALDERNKAGGKVRQPDRHIGGRSLMDEDPGLGLVKGKENKEEIDDDDDEDPILDSLAGGGSGSGENDADRLIRLGGL